MRHLFLLCALTLAARAQSGQILSHDLHITIRPAAGLDIEDRLRLRVSGSQGLDFRLNPGARIESPRDARFAGGVLHLDLPPGESAVDLRYSLPVPHDLTDANSACFLPHAGHVRGQFLWHPSFGIDPVGAWTDFHIEVRIPREYRVATSLPQTERVEGDIRIVEARTVQPTAWITLAYDRDWQVEAREIDGIRLEFFVTPDFTLAPDAVAAYFRTVYAAFSKRFGPLPARYAAIVQLRNVAANSWRFTSNQAVFSTAKPELLFKPNLPLPEEPFAHEVAHLWHQGSAGPAASFLGEGWAGWAESVALANRAGAEPVRALWTFRSSVYLVGFDGRMSLLDDQENGGIAYMKGPWIFHMLESALGPAPFDATMRDFFARSRATPSGWEVLAECAQRHAPPEFDARAFLQPWIAEKTAPKLTSEIAGATVTIRQDPPVYFLSLIVEAGKERRRIWLKGAETRVTFAAPVTDVKLDPDQALLLRR
jgi:hypothetical protein